MIDGNQAVNFLELWPVLAICSYIAIAIITIRHLSYECCMTHGRYHYTFFSVIGGLFWPLTFLYSLLKPVILGGCVD